MGIRFDRSRKHGVVFGHETEKFYQDGCFFDGVGNFVRSASGKAPVEPETEPAPLVEASNAKADKIATLSKMTVPALKKMASDVHDITGVELPKGGTGAKARLVTYLAENTAD